MDHLIFTNFSQPETNEDSLTLIRPTKSNFYWKRRHPEEIAKLQRKHAEVVSQGSLFHKDAAPLAQCPYSFHYTWFDDQEVKHESTCDDWETSATFFNRRRALGSEEAALQSMSSTFNEEYPNKGFALAFSTHSLRNWQWLLVGVLRADINNQTKLL